MKACGRCTDSTGFKAYRPEEGIERSGRAAIRISKSLTSHKSSTRVRGSKIGGQDAYGDITGVLRSLTRARDSMMLMDATIGRVDIVSVAIAASQGLKAGRATAAGQPALRSQWSSTHVRD